MSKARKKSESRGLPEPAAGQVPSRTDFDVVLGLIYAARSRAVAAVNTALIELYWTIGEHISQRVSADGWGKGT
ncbi:MAG: DUF1016 N-terminal domain-containing protein, partial [Pirellulales bacterium]